MGEFVAYNPHDDEQVRFLDALALSQVGSGTGSSAVAGGTPFNLSNEAMRQLQTQLGLDFSNSYDQSAGAWYVAQEAYTSQTGRSLDADLDAGDVSRIDSALSNVWSSISGNQSAPQGLASSVESGDGAGGSFQLPSLGGGDSSQSGGILGNVANIFKRGGLILLGGVIVLVSLWALLNNKGIARAT